MNEKGETAVPEIRKFRVTFGFDCTSLGAEAHLLEQHPLFRKCFREEVEEKLGGVIPGDWRDLDVGPSGYGLRTDPETGVIDESEMVDLLRTLVNQANPSQKWSASIVAPASFTGCWIDPDSFRWYPLFFFAMQLNHEPWLALGTTKLFEARYTGTVSELARTQLSAMCVRLVVSWRVDP